LEKLWTEVGNGGFDPGVGLFGVDSGNFSAIDSSTAEGEVVNLLDDLERKAMGCTFAQWMEDWVNGVDLWTRDFTKPGPDPTGTGA
jgi:hypothetical protein